MAYCGNDRTNVDDRTPASERILKQAAEASAPVSAATACASSSLADKNLHEVSSCQNSNVQNSNTRRSASQCDRSEKGHVRPPLPAAAARPPCARAHSPPARVTPNEPGKNSDPARATRVRNSFARGAGGGARARGIRPARYSTQVEYQCTELLCVNPRNSHAVLEFSR